jgi:hypothetical protein
MLKIRSDLQPSSLEKKNHNLFLLAAAKMRRIEDTWNLHSVYHRPNGWDYCSEGSGVPRGESSMWGDYHARELAL